MDYESRLRISYYQNVTELHREHGVYLVRHADTGRLYVRKMMSTFNIDVYHTLKNLNIPGIPRIEEMYEEDGTLTVIEEYIEGMNLQQMMDSNYAFSRETILYYITELVSILGKLHRLPNPIIHRDIKPSNIMIGRDGKLYLIDFNAGKFYSSNDSRSEDTSLLGTHGYAAPEQYGFGKSTPRTDIYSIGVLMRNLVSHVADQSHMGSITQVADKCTMLRPEDRYESVDEIVRALRGKSKMRFLPPGFRTCTFWHMPIALGAYFIMIIAIISMKIDTDNNAIKVLYRVIGSLVFASAVACTCNYLDVQRILPLCKSKSPLMRALGILVLNVLVLILWIIVLAIGVAILS